MVDCATSRIALQQPVPVACKWSLLRRRWQLGRQPPVPVTDNVRAGFAGRHDRIDRARFSLPQPSSPDRQHKTGLDALVNAGGVHVSLDTSDQSRILW